MDADELYNYVGSEPEHCESSKLEYLLVKRRFRHFSQTPSRAERRPRRAKGKGRGKSPRRFGGEGKGVGKQFSQAFKGSPSPVGGRSLAGGKGKPKGEAKKPSTRQATA